MVEWSILVSTGIVLIAIYVVSHSIGKKMVQIGTDMDNYPVSTEDAMISGVEAVGEALGEHVGGELSEFASQLTEALKANFSSIKEGFSAQLSSQFEAIIPQVTEAVNEQLNIFYKKISTAWSNSSRKVARSVEGAAPDIHAIAEDKFTQLLMNVVPKRFKPLLELGQYALSSDEPEDNEDETVDNDVGE